MSFVPQSCSSDGLQITPADGKTSPHFGVTVTTSGRETWEPPVPGWGFSCVCSGVQLTPGHLSRSFQLCPASNFLYIWYFFVSLPLSEINLGVQGLLGKGWWANGITLRHVMLDFRGKKAVKYLWHGRLGEKKGEWPGFKVFFKKKVGKQCWSHVSCPSRSAGCVPCLNLTFSGEIWFPFHHFPFPLLATY